MNELAPIVLFAYNRPIHTEQMLEALSVNELASESLLFIYCDGEKGNSTKEQKDQISEVRKVVRKKNWCKEVFIIEAEKNKGLANSIIEGVTEIIEKYGKVIVLEDDLISSPYLLRYMNQALNYYESRQSVFSIAANRPPYNFFDIPEDYKYDVFASLRNFSTGWATWKNRWAQVDWSLNYLDELLKDEYKLRAFNRAGEDLKHMLLMQRDKKIDSWSIRFTYAHFVNHAIAILPCISYVDNIGFDGTGIHSGTNEKFFRNSISIAKQNPVLLDVLYEDSRIINSFYSYYSGVKRPIWKKLINRISHALGKKKVFTIKKKVYLS